jgi:proton-translocating NADH-quinone oxidoreductase chain N
MTSLFIIIPLLAVLLLNLPLGAIKKKLGFTLALLLTLTQTLLALLGSKDFWLSLNQSWEPFSLLNLAIKDSFSILMLLLIGIISLSALLIAQGTLKNQNLLFIFINLLLLTMVGMNGIVMIEDLFSFYVFLEVTSISSFILIAFNREKDSLEGSFKYLLLSAIATLMMLSSIALLMMAAGSSSFSAINLALQNNSRSLFTAIALCLFICGLLIKGGLAPFNGWVPDAYAAAPAAVSVLLAGIVTKVSGIYLLMRLVNTIIPANAGINFLLMLCGTITLLSGALAALGQSDFKRMLAYSSISQIGYIVLSLGTGTLLGFAGAVFHLFNHSIFKSQLFMNSAAVENQTGCRNMDLMGGLAAKMPVTGFTCALACLSTAGIPPLAGFWSKLVIILALWKSGNYIFAYIAVLASLITLAYFLSLQRRVFFGKLAEGYESLKEAGFSMLLPAVVMSLITIGIGFGFPFMFNTILLPVDKIL